jgi:aspartyl-tRNA(Asn)/glutamyl-tRNA(Gln) amidotransferase subunit A
MFAPIRERFEGGRDVKAPEYVAAWRLLRELRAQWQARVAGYDAVIMPSAPNLPPDAARLMEDAEYYVTENLLTLRNTRVGNLMGVCGMTLPTGVPSCGIMLLGAAFGEEALAGGARGISARIRRYFYQENARARGAAGRSCCLPKMPQDPLQGFGFAGLGGSASLPCLDNGA